MTSGSQWLAPRREAGVDQVAQALAHHGAQRWPALAQTPDYQRAILDGHRMAALHCVAQAMDEGATLVQASVRIIQPALYEVGHLWQSRRISVSQEHIASAISQNVLVGAYLKAEFRPPLGRTAMLACVQGNHHGLGLRMVSDALETQGWDVVFLGADVPLRDLVAEVDARRPDLLALSASLPLHLDTARQTIDVLRADMGSACPTVWVGGVATLSAPSMWRQTGADMWAADALHALEQL